MTIYIKKTNQLEKVNAMMKNSNYLLIFTIMSLVATLTSCGVDKNIAYFRDISDSVGTYSIPKANFSEPLIEPDDILDIRIQTIDPEAAISVNEAATNNNVVTPTLSQQVVGFVVDREGEVELPFIGKVKISGKTTFDARDLIRSMAQKYFKNPTVQVRFVNFKVTVIGEVNRPSSYTMPNEKVTVLDAIGLAGDLTIYGKRENVLLMRDSGSGKEMIRLNLNDSRIFSSPYFYLKQNDVIYVEPRASKIAAADNAQLTRISVGASLVSAIAIILNLIL